MHSKLPRLLGVLGAGQMGAGIAQLAAMKGLDVILCDMHSAAVERSIAATNRSLSKMVSKQQLTQEQADSAVSRIRRATDMQVLGQADFVVEAINECETSKKAAFLLLDRASLPTVLLTSCEAPSPGACTTGLQDVQHIMKPEAMLASNTSSISITRLAAVTRQPHRVIGMHYMNPVVTMKLVELIRGIATSEETFNTAQELAQFLGKETCISQDRPGFIVNRVLMPMINEAFYTLMEGVGSAEDIDRGMKLGTNQPMGPLQLADFIGLDTCLSIMRVLHSGTGDSKYRPCPLLVQYVDAGWLGNKVYKGVFDYPKPAC